MRKQLLFTLNPNCFKLGAGMPPDNHESVHATQIGDEQVVQSLVRQALIAVVRYHLPGIIQTEPC
jgi:hypothetical protein